MFNKLYYIILVVIITVFASVSCKKNSVVVGDNQVSIQGKYVGIILVDYTALRLDPMIYSSKIDLMKKGDSVEIIDKSKEKTVLGNTKEYWYKVKTESGLLGWCYGGNLRIFEKGKSVNAGDLRRKIDEEKIDKIIKALKGRWWSTNQRGDFTTQSLKLYPDGQYESSWKSGSPVKGKFSIDVEKMEISFDGKTTFNAVIKLLPRGQEYDLRVEDKGNKFLFKKISAEPDDKVDELIEEDKVDPTKTDSDDSKKDGTKKDDSKKEGSTTEDAE